MDEFSRPSSKSGVRRFLAVGAAVFFVLLVCSAFWASFTIFEPISFQSPRVITISSGLSLSQASKMLASAGIIRNAQLFKILVKSIYSGAPLKAGEYRITEDLSSIGAAELFVKGMPRKELTIRFIEGWSITDIAQYLESNSIVSRADFLSETLKDYSREFPFLQSRIHGISLEGYLFPDTYRIYEGSSATDIIEKMLENFARQYAGDIEKETSAQSRSVNDVVTLASILEQEVKSGKDRRMVADIFYRRIKGGMPLQADSTINYVTGRADPGARASDLVVESPYNTYRNKGLPPGPICNPGIDAIRAALTPAANPYWFFLTTETGEVIYSKTFEEHVRNKIKYLSKKR